MERTFNKHNWKMSALLKSVNLEHVHCKLVRKCVTLDVLLNLTPEDLDYLEIVNPDDRSLLLNDFKLYQKHFDHITTRSSFDRNKMLSTSMQQLKAINSLLSTMLNQVTRLKTTGSSVNRLLDDVTPVSKVIDLLAEQALHSIDLIESDISQELMKDEGFVSRLSNSKLLPATLVVGSVAALLFLLSSSHVWNVALPSR